MTASVVCVRLKAGECDPEYDREFVGIYWGTLDQIRDAVDEALDPEICEYLRLPAGGIQSATCAGTTIGPKVPDVFFLDPDVDIDDEAEGDDARLFSGSCFSQQLDSLMTLQAGGDRRRGDWQPLGPRLGVVRQA